MDAKSGVFTAPAAGSYLFTIHACTHDMHKALLSIRHNGNQVNEKIDLYTIQTKNFYNMNDTNYF